VDNPLLYREPDDQDNDVRTFHKLHELADVVDVDLLIKAARLARDPDLFKASGDLSKIERKALEKEKTSSIWQQPKDLRVIVLTCCIGAIVQYVSGLGRSLALTKLGGGTKAALSQQIWAGLYRLV